MQGNLFCMFVALCCLHAVSEPVRVAEGSRKRRSDERDGIALSKEIFKNITKQLRENINREGSTDKSDRLHQSIKLEESRQHSSYQAYHHHEHHWGPYFEGKVEGSEGTQVAAHVGAEALLNCRVGMLKDKTVMWLRRNVESAQLLTVGPAPYSGDSRVSVKFQYPNNWRLSINPVKKSDAGGYMCQISTHPPRAISTNLTVLPPLITINGDETHEMKDRFYKSGSSINLACVISDEYLNSVPTKATITTQEPRTSTTPSTTTTEVSTKTSTVFNRIDLVVNKSWSVETTTITSTVSISKTTKKEENSATTTVKPIETTTPNVSNNMYGLVWKKQGMELTEGVSWRNLSATFTVASASQNDSGSYSCHLRNHSQALANVHVLTAGENQAAVHHDNWNQGNLSWKSSNFILVLATLFSTSIFYVNLI